MHEKALLTATVFGLPMFSVTMPGTRDTTSAGGSTVPTPGPGGIGVNYADLHVDTSATTPHTSTGLTPTASYLSGPAGVSSNPNEPALPRFVANVDAANQVLRGVGFRGGVFTESGGAVPLMGAPGTEFGGTQAPFTSTTYFPFRMWTTSYFADLTGGATNLVVTPVQHRVSTPGATTATRRVFSNLDLRLFYADSTGAGANAAAGATAPSISGVTATLAGGVVTFSASILSTNAGTDNAKSAWVTYNFGNTGCHCWDSVDLSRSAPGSTSWTGSLTLPGGVLASDLRFIVQAVNGAALVGVANNAEAYYGLTSAAAPTLAPSNLALSAPASGVYGGTAVVSATLTSGATPLVGRTVVLRLGSAIQSVVTGAGGVASATLPIQDTPGSTQAAAVFGGDATTAASSAVQSFTIDKQATSLTLESPANSVKPGAQSGIYATLRDASGAALPFRSVMFVVGDAANPGFARQVSTGADGRASLGTVPQLGLGTYPVRAYYNGPVTLDPWSGTSASAINLSDPYYVSSTSGPGSLDISALGGLLASVTTANSTFKHLDDGFSVLFGKGSTTTYMTLKNTDPGTFHYELGLDNETGVPLNAGQGATTTTIITIPGLPAGGLNVTVPAEALALADPAFTMQGNRPVRVRPNDDNNDDHDHDSEIPAQVWFAYSAPGGDCTRVTDWIAGQPGDGAAVKCIKVTDFALQKRHGVKIDLNLEFRLKNTTGWLAGENPQMNFRGGFPFTSVTTITLDATYGDLAGTHPGNQITGIVGVGQAVTAVGGFVFDTNGGGIGNATIRIYNSAPSASNLCTTNGQVAEYTTSPDGFYFISQKGINDGTTQATGPNPLPSGIKYYVAVCNVPGVGQPYWPARFIDHKLANKEFDGEDFYVSSPSFIVVSTQPSSGRVGRTLGTIQIAVQDAFGYTVTADNSTVITLTADGGALSGIVTRTVSGGIANFSGLKFGSVGTWTISVAGAPNWGSGTVLNMITISP